MKIYRVKHKPSGLYYKPAQGGSNLSTGGKIYRTANHGLKQSISKGGSVYVDVLRPSRPYSILKAKGFTFCKETYKDVRLETDAKDWVLEPMN